MENLAQWSTSHFHEHLQPYPIGNVLNIRERNHLPMQSTYEITTDQGHYIVRLSHPIERMDVDFERALIESLKSANLPVASMIAPSSNNDLSERSLHITVFEARAGRYLGGFEITSRHCEQIGIFLGNMHEACANFKHLRRDALPENEAEFLAKHCKQHAQTSEHRRDAEWLANQIEQFSSPTRLPKGITYGTLTPKHALFERNRLASITHFEQAAPGIFMFDVASALIEWSYLLDRFIPERARGLLAGYQSQRQLKRGERDAIFSLCRHLLVVEALRNMFHFEMKSFREQERGVYRDYRHALDRIASLDLIGYESFANLVLLQPSGLRGWF